MTHRRLKVLKVTWRRNFRQLFISLRFPSIEYTECQAFSPVGSPCPLTSKQVLPHPFWYQGPGGGAHYLAGEGARRGSFGPRDGHSCTLGMSIAPPSWGGQAVR
jgi:hypothetical protein